MSESKTERFKDNSIFLTFQRVWAYGLLLIINIQDETILKQKSASFSVKDQEVNVSDMTSQKFPPHSCSTQLL